MCVWQLAVAKCVNTVKIRALVNIVPFMAGSCDGPFSASGILKGSGNENVTNGK